jgi:hypothetical protein
VRTLVTVGKAPAEIVRVAKEQKADLILLGSGGRRGWRHVFRSTVADRVRRKAPIPVIALDADEFSEGWDPGRGGAVSHSDELVGVLRDMDSPPGLPSAAATSHPQKAASNGPEHPTLPCPAALDERGARQAHEPAWATGV